MVEVRHLRYFVALAEELHFGRAAARLKMGQSPLSQQIRQLEGKLGTELVRRGHHVVGLTDAGEAFLPVAREVLADLDQGVRLARRAGKGEVGSLVVGFVGDLTGNILPQSLKAHRERFPAIDIDLFEGTTGELLDGLQRGQLDVAFVRHPGPVEEIEYEQLIEESLYAAVPSGHRLAEKCVSLPDLSGEPFVMPAYPTAQGLRHDIDRACFEAGLDPMVSREATPLAAVLLLVAAGAGVALVPASRAHTYPVPGVEFVRLSNPPMTNVGMAWRCNDQSQVVTHFLATIRRTTAKQTEQPDVRPRAAPAGSRQQLAGIAQEQLEEREPIPPTMASR